MTVCIASDGYPPVASGIAQFNWHLTQPLTSNGHSVVQLNIDRADGAKDSIIVEGSLTRVYLAHSFQTHYKNWLPYFRPGGIDAAYWIATGLAMREWLLSNAPKFHIDILEASDFGGYAAFLSDESLPPLVITGHASMLQLGQYNFRTVRETTYDLLLRLERISYDNAKAIIVHSNKNHQSLALLTQTKVFKVLMPWYMNDKQGETLKTKKASLLVLGNLQPVKGVETLLNALRILKAKSDFVSVTWVGADGYYSPQFPKYSSYLRHTFSDLWDMDFKWLESEPHVQILKRIEENQIIVVPSLFETFGYTILEAAQFKKAVIMTDAVGASEFFNDKKNALIIPAGDEKQLANAILDLVNDEVRTKELGEAAYQNLITQFDSVEIIHQRLSVYQSVIKDDQISTGFTNAMDEVKHYQTFWREVYFKIRAYLKQIIKK